jgi:Asp-tRNA(Asn)/Glu-tRNA(Gln) amidotransferase A subunit family amidase
MYPAGSSGAWVLHELSLDKGAGIDPLVSCCLTNPINFTGHPAASIPAGLTADGLPLGMQIVGRCFHDATVRAASAALERPRPWRHTCPG